MKEFSFEINLNSPTLWQDQIRTGIRSLVECRPTTRHRELLEWEIRIYEWILAQPDAEEKARSWFGAREQCGHDKRKRMKFLGWRIP